MQGFWEINFIRLKLDIEIRHTINTFHFSNKGQFIGKMYPESNNVIFLVFQSEPFCLQRKVAIRLF